MIVGAFNGIIINSNISTYVGYPINQMRGATLSYIDSYFKISCTYMATMCSMEYPINSIILISIGDINSVMFSTLYNVMILQILMSFFSSQL